MPQHTPVHKIHTQASKQARAVAPALLPPPCTKPSPRTSLEKKGEKKKKTQAAQSLSDTDPHMISPQCSKQAGTSRYQKR